MKKLFTFFLALVASVSAIYAQSGSCGDNLRWTLSNGTLTISGTGAMADYYYDDTPWYDYRSSIKSIVISDGVTSIGYKAFYGCESLTSITIPNSVTSIGWRAFSYCYSLTSVTIPNSVTSIGEYAFCGCYSLTSVTIGYSVTNIGEYAFAYCSSLNSVTIGNSVTSIGECAFEDCTGLTSVTIPNSVTSIGNRAFSKCSSLTSVTIGNSVTNIGNSAFSSCKSLTSVTIPNSVTSIGSDAFIFCSSLTSVTIGNSVTSIGECAFAYCSSLRSINVDSNNLNYSSVDGVLFNKDRTTLVVYPGGKQDAYTIPNSVTNIGEYAFYGCSSLTSITIPNSVTSIGSKAFAYCNKLVDVYCYATTPPATEGENTFSHYNAFLHVPCESKKAYMVDAVWGNFKYIECISSEGIEDIQSDEVQSTKVVKDGQVFILRNGKTYTMQGQEVK